MSKTTMEAAAMMYRDSTDGRCLGCGVEFVRHPLPGEDFGPLGDFVDNVIVMNDHDVFCPVALDAAGVQRYVLMIFESDGETEIERVPCGSPAELGRAEAEAVARHWDRDSWGVGAFREDRGSSEQFALSDDEWHAMHAAFEAELPQIPAAK